KCRHFWRGKQSTCEPVAAGLAASGRAIAVPLRTMMKSRRRNLNLSQFIAGNSCRRSLIEGPKRSAINPIYPVSSTAAVAGEPPDRRRRGRLPEVARADPDSKARRHDVSAEGLTSGL